jgi:hypothetical protein
MADATDAPPDLAALGKRYARTKTQLDTVKAEMREAVRVACTVHGVEEAQAARLLGVDRMSVRSWLGKR